jgi:hypothetical protein
VRTYPELYFARFAVLGEGASEEVVLPRWVDARKNAWRMAADHRLRPPPPRQVLDLPDDP